jgi:hypothetical protein
MKDGRRIYGWFGVLIVCQLTILLNQLQSTNLLKRIDTTTTVSGITTDKIHGLFLGLKPQTIRDLEEINERTTTKH